MGQSTQKQEGKKKKQKRSVYCYVCRLTFNSPPSCQLFHLRSSVLRNL